MAPSIAELRATEGFSVDPDHAVTLPGRYYHDPEIYEREREAIWFNSWQFVGYLKDLQSPGDYITGGILDQKIVVVRGGDDALRGFYNVCMHRGHVLVEGNGNKSIFTCPFHAWSYDTTGVLRAAGNAENVAGFALEDFTLAEVRVEAFLHMVFVNLDPDAPTMSERYPGFTDDILAAVPNFDALNFYRRDHLDMKCNWKFFPDMNECYHCPFIHPIMGDSVEAYLDLSWETTEYEFWDRNIIRAKPDLAADSRPYDFGSHDIGDVHIWYMWPNLFFLAHQGSSNFKIQLTVPSGADTSYQILDYWVLNDPPDEADLGHINNYRYRIMPDDVAAMEKQQLGVRCRGYRQGRLMVDPERSWRSEHGVHHFQKLVWDALNS